MGLWLGDRINKAIATLSAANCRRGKPRSERCSTSGARSAELFPIVIMKLHAYAFARNNEERATSNASHTQLWLCVSGRNYKDLSGTDQVGITNLLAVRLVNLGVARA